MMSSLSREVSFGSSYLDPQQSFVTAEASDATRPFAKHGVLRHASLPQGSSGSGIQCSTERMAIAQIRCRDYLCAGLSFGSLFSGIGGIDLGLERAGMVCRWQVEIDEYCRKVLAKHWPEVPKYGDIRELTGAELEPADLIAGGFPC